MIEHPRQPDLEGAGVAAEDALAYVEGEKLAPSARDQLERALARDAQLRDWLEALRADRALVRAWVQEGDAQAPAGLVDDALAQAQRDALTGAEGMPRHRRVFAARGLALAAMFVVAAGASVFFWRASTQQPTPSTPKTLRFDESELLTQAPPDDDVRAQARSEETPSSAPAAKSRAPLADASTADSAAERDAARASREVQRADRQRLADAGAQASERTPNLVFPAAAPGAEAAARDDFTARAQAANVLHLAREGRLALIASTDQPAAFVAAFVDLVRQAEPGLRFHAASAALADARAVALGELTLPADAAAIEALRVMLVQIGAREARFVERDEPLPLPVDALGAGPAWWRAPASRWTPRVVVELRLDAAGAPTP